MRVSDLLEQTQHETFGINFLLRGISYKNYFFYKCPALIVGNIRLEKNVF